MYAVFIDAFYSILLFYFSPFQFCFVSLLVFVLLFLSDYFLGVKSFKLVVLHWHLFLVIELELLFVCAGGSVFRRSDKIEL